MRGSTASGLLLLVLIPALGRAAEPLGTVGLLPDPDPERRARIQKAVEDAVGPDLRLVVAGGSGHWAGTTETLRRLFDEDGVDVLLVPPDRSVVHLAAQLATRRHVPAFEIALRGSPAATSAVTAGTFWLVTCEAPAVGGEPPDGEGLEVAARLAVEAARAVLAEPGFRAGEAGTGWRASLPASCRDPRDLPADHESQPDPADPSSGSRHRGLSP